ncbi:MAG: L-ribulose-5-phosphate 4-epimerase AraD [Chthoniobacterales bacterium]|nr:L-ribulose-5-phosphate 4-epimerase AraD [Chthoniobacterales bacterium]
MGKFTEIREECCEANRALGASGLVDLTFGNVSVLDREAGIFAIKPSGVDYASLTPDSMALVDLEGKTVAGKLSPSSDTPTHTRLFQAFDAIRSVAHTHSRYAVSFAQAGREIPLLGTTHADYFRGPVPVTRGLMTEEINGDYELETGNVIVARFVGMDPLSVPAVLVRNHGPFAWGTSGAKAIETAQALEIIAQIAWQTLCLHPSAESAPDVLRDKHFFRKHGSSAYYGQRKSAHE